MQVPCTSHDNCKGSCGNQYMCSGCRGCSKPSVLKGGLCLPVGIDTACAIAQQIYYHWWSLIAWRVNKAVRFGWTFTVHHECEILLSLKNGSENNLSRSFPHCLECVDEIGPCSMKYPIIHTLPARLLVPMARFVWMPAISLPKQHLLPDQNLSVTKQLNILILVDMVLVDLKLPSNLCDAVQKSSPAFQWAKDKPLFNPTSLSICTRSLAQHNQITIYFFSGTRVSRQTCIFEQKLLCICTVQNSKKLNAKF